MKLAQTDASIAFLYDDLKETIFMKRLERYNDGSVKICRLIEVVWS